jgi:thiamine-phosphate pyrophosphorylase
MTVHGGVLRPRIIVITDPAFGDGRILHCVAAVARALPVGAFAVQLRDKSRPISSLRLFAHELRMVTQAVGAALIVNGLPQLAREVAADGVHLGKGTVSVEDARRIAGKHIWISVAAHTDGDVRAAAEGGVDAVLVSPVFASRPPRSGSPYKVARGVAALRAARSYGRGRLRIYALGGITSENAAACASAGADGVAVIRTVLASADPSAQARAVHDAWAGR